MLSQLIIWSFGQTIHVPSCRSWTEHHITLKTYFCLYLPIMGWAEHFSFSTLPLHDRALPQKQAFVHGARLLGSFSWCVNLTMHIWKSCFYLLILLKTWFSEGPVTKPFHNESTRIPV